MRIDQLQRLGKRDGALRLNAGQLCDFIHGTSILTVPNLVNGRFMSAGSKLVSQRAKDLSNDEKGRQHCEGNGDAK